MSKYSKEFKLKVINICYRKNHGCTNCSKCKNNAYNLNRNTDGIK